MAISNTTVISNLAFTGSLELLQRLLDVVYISTEVYAEVQDGYAEGHLFYHGIEQHIVPFNDHGWMHLTGLYGDEELRLFHRLSTRFHRGEASSLAIAFSRSWVFLTDDAKARKAANDLGVEVSGTLGVWVQAVRAGFVTASAADSLLAKIIAHGFRSPRPTISELL
jgi:predicted nucleic acid-binding protein